MDNRASKTKEWLIRANLAHIPFKREARYLAGLLDASIDKELQNRPG